MPAARMCRRGVDIQRGQVVAGSKPEADSGSPYPIFLCYRNRTFHLLPTPLLLIAFRHPTLGRHSLVDILGRAAFRERRATIHNKELSHVARRIPASCWPPVSSSLTRAIVAVVLVAAATASCSRDSGDDVTPSLWPFASNRVPLTMSDDVALVSADVACVLNSFESRIACVDSRRRAVGVFGREGEGPGEFRGPPGLERGPDGMLTVFDIRSSSRTSRSRWGVTALKASWAS